MTFRQRFLFISLESETRNCESAIGLRQFRYSPAKYSANSLATFAMVDFLSRDLCMLTGCKVSIPEEIRESNPAHFDMSRDTWEVAGWKSDRVMGFVGVVWVRKRTCPEDLRARCRIVEFSSAIRWLSRVIQFWQCIETISLRSIRNIFRASTTVASWCYGNYVKYKETEMFQLCNILLQHVNNACTNILFSCCPFFRR